MSTENTTQTNSLVLHLAMASALVMLCSWPKKGASTTDLHKDEQFLNDLTYVANVEEDLEDAQFSAILGIPMLQNAVLDDPDAVKAETRLITAYGKAFNEGDANFLSDIEFLQNNIDNPGEDYTAVQARSTLWLIDHYMQPDQRGQAPAELISALQNAGAATKRPAYAA